MDPELERLESILMEYGVLLPPIPEYSSPIYIPLYNIEPLEYRNKGDYLGYSSTEETIKEIESYDDNNESELNSELVEKLYD